MKDRADKPSSSRAPKKSRSHERTQAELLLGETERLIARSQKDYRELYEHAPTGYVTTDAKGVIQAINKAAQELLGLRSSKTQIYILTSFVAPSDRHRFLNHLADSRQGKGVSFCSVDLMTRHGTRVPVQISTRCSSDGKRAETLYWSAITDLSERRAAELKFREINTELEKLVLARTRELREANALLRKEVLDRKKAEEQLREYARAMKAANQELVKANDAAREAHRARLDTERRAREDAENTNRMKDEFLAILSHELRTPLNAVMGWIRLIRGGKLKTVDIERALEVIDRNARTQAKMIGDLLEMSRIISGKFSLELQQVDLHKVLETTVESLRPAAAAKKIHLSTAVESNAPQVFADAGRVEQIIGNLVSNAIKFTPAGGRVDVRLSRSESCAELRIADTGIGIRPEHLPNIFDRFRQGDASTTRRYGGLGLGLSIARHLVAAHGGSLRVESEGEGKGATFIVTLPVLAESKPGARQASVEEPAEIRGMKVLVVDDDEDALLFICRALELSKATVRCARSAAEAVGEFQNFRPDVLVSDIAMPDCDGYELLKEVRAIDDARHRFTPALALTAFAKLSDRERALANGFQAYLSKPVEPAQLTQALADLLQKPVAATDLPHTSRK